MSKPEQDTVTKTVYLYQTKYSNQHVSGHDWSDDSDYVVLAEPVEVTFKLRDRAAVVVDRIKAIDGEIQNIRAEATDKVNRLTELKQKLLAITSQSGENT